MFLVLKSGIKSFKKHLYSYLTMKFKTIFNSALILGLSLFLTNCGPESPFIEPEPEELPPITTEGLILLAV
jgi:hypothetical protein